MRDTIQLTEEQCIDMMVPYGSAYRGGLIILPDHPKGFGSKGKGKGGDLSPLEHSPDVLDTGMNYDSWVRMNLDTGAAIHAFPASLGVANMDTGDRRNTTSDSWYTTASGDEIPDMGQLELTLKDETQRTFRLQGNVTRVHKCLVSASKLCAGGRNASTKHEIWLNSEGGVVYPSDGPIAKGLARAYKRLVQRYGSSSVIPVYQERGVYNVYFRLLARNNNPVFLTEETDENDRGVEYMPSGIPDWAAYRLSEMGMAEAENRGDITDDRGEELLPSGIPAWRLSEMEMADNRSDITDDPMMAAEAATDSP